MPIRTACSSCGKKLQVRDELAGKKVKCPDCGKVFIAASSAAGPSATGADAAAIKAAPTKPSKAAPPKGGPPPMSRAEASQQPTLRKPVGQPVRRQDDDEDGEDDLPVRRDRAPAGSGSRRLLWIVLAGVLVLGGAAGVYYFVFMDPPATVGPIVRKNGPPVVPAVDPNQDKTGQEKPAPVEEKTNVEKPAPSGSGALADLVPGDALFFATASGELLNNKAFDAVRQGLGVNIDDAFQQATGFEMKDLERVSIFTLADFAESSQSQEPPMAIVVQTNKPIDQKRVALAVKKLMTGKGPALTAQFPNHQTILIGTPAHLVMYHQKQGKTKATGVLERALAQATTSKGVLIAVVVPPEAEEFGAMALKDAPVPLAPFLKTKSVLASLDVTDKLKLQATLFMADAAAAGEAKTAADGMIAFASGMLGLAGKDAQSAALALTAQQALKDLKINVKDNELAIAFETDMKVVMDAVIAGLKAAKGGAAAADDSNNLKDIALAWHNYHDVHKSLPPQTVGKGLSWRVAILPYIEQDQLYKQFKLDEPWDSEHNKKLIPLMPKIYAGAGKAEPGFTFYQTFVGKKTINADPKKGFGFARIIDGTSKTIIIAEAPKAVAWTKPDDINITDTEPIVLGGANPKFTLAAYADGSIHRLPRDLDDGILRLLIDPADRKVIPNFDEPGPKTAPPAFESPPKQRDGKKGDVPRAKQ